jgi:flagellar basal-body rod protein FlgB
VLDQIGNSLERYMSLLAARQKLVASNIANADTPGYTTKDIDFHFEFMSQVNGGQPRALDVDSLPAKSDGNNVSLDREARLLAENAIRFSVASSLLRSQIRSIRSAIQEGRNG